MRKRHASQYANFGSLPIVRIQPYAYSEAPGIKHLFFYFEGSREAVPYFLLEPSVWQTVQKEIME